MQYHIRNNGDMGVCKAREGNCPLKNSDGSPARHFDSLKEATEVYEKMMESKVFSTLTKEDGKVNNPNVNTDDFGNRVDVGNVSSDDWEQPDFTVPDAQWEQPPVLAVNEIGLSKEEDKKAYKEAVEFYQNLIGRKNDFPELKNAFDKLERDFNNVNNEDVSELLIAKNKAMADFTVQYNLAKADNYLDYVNSNYDRSVLTYHSSKKNLDKDLNEYYYRMREISDSTSFDGLKVVDESSEKKFNTNLKLWKDPKDGDFVVQSTCFWNDENKKSSGFDQFSPFSEVVYSKQNNVSNLGRVLVMKKLLESDHFSNNEPMSSVERQQINALAASVQPFFEESMKYDVWGQERDNYCRKQLELTDNGTNVLKAKALLLENNYLGGLKTRPYPSVKHFDRVRRLLNRGSRFAVGNDLSERAFKDNDARRKLVDDVNKMFN